MDKYCEDVDMHEEETFEDFTYSRSQAEVTMEGTVGLEKLIRNQRIINKNPTPMFLALQTKNLRDFNQAIDNFEGETENRLSLVAQLVSLLEDYLKFKDKSYPAFDGLVEEAIEKGKNWLRRYGHDYVYREPEYDSAYSNSTRSVQSDVKSSPSAYDYFYGDPNKTKFYQRRVKENLENLVADVRKKELQQIDELAQQDAETILLGGKPESRSFHRPTIEELWVEAQKLEKQRQEELSKRHILELSRARELEEKEKKIVELNKSLLGKVIDNMFDEYKKKNNMRE